MTARGRYCAKPECPACGAHRTIRVHADGHQSFRCLKCDAERFRRRRDQIGMGMRPVHEALMAQVVALERERFGAPKYLQDEIDAKLAKLYEGFDDDADSKVQVDIYRARQATSARSESTSAATG